MGNQINIPFEDLEDENIALMYEISQLREELDRANDEIGQLHQYLKEAEEEIKDLQYQLEYGT